MDFFTFNKFIILGSSFINTELTLRLGSRLALCQHFELVLITFFFFPMCIFIEYI